MGQLSGDALVLTNHGVMSIQELQQASGPVYIIVGGKPHEMLYVHPRSAQKMNRIILKNGMEICVSCDQQLIDENGNCVALSQAQNVTLDRPDRIYVWQSTLGTYNEGYICALACHSRCYMGALVGLMVRIPDRYTSRVHECYPIATLFEYRDETGADIKIEPHMHCNEWTHYRVTSVALKSMLRRYGISESVCTPCERASFDFTQGFLRGIFDAEAIVLHDALWLYAKDATHIKIVQRMLLHMGVACNVAAMSLCITNVFDLMGFQYAVGFGIEEKAELLAEVIASKRRQHFSTTPDKAISGVLDIQTLRTKKTFDVGVAGGVISVNGILARV